MTSYLVCLFLSPSLWSAITLCRYMHCQYNERVHRKEQLALSLGAVSNSDVGGHGSPLLPVSCSFDDLDFTDF